MAIVGERAWIWVYIWESSGVGVVSGVRVVSPVRNCVELAMLPCRNVFTIWPNLVPKSWSDKSRKRLSLVADEVSNLGQGADWMKVLEDGLKI